jgi:hypothetical protein
MSDFEKTLRIIGALGRVAAIANHAPYAPYYYYRYHYGRPPVVVVEQPVIVEKHIVVETPVIVDRHVIVPSEPEGLQDDNEGLYSLKLGASFNLESMQIPGYVFTAARLTSDPVEGSPLHELGLREGDAITRLGGTAVNELEVLEQQEGNTEIRFIKKNTEKVLLANVYIPTDDEILNEDETHYAP